MQRIRLTLLVVAAAGMTGCESREVRAAHDAEQRLRIVEQSHPTRQEICIAKREVAEAWLATLDQAKYQSAKLAANAACLDAELDNLRQ